MRLLRRFPVFVFALVAVTMGLARPAVAATPRVAVLHSTMSGANEIGHAGDPNASGMTVVVLNAVTGRVCYVIRVSDVSSPLTAAHIHVGDAGTAGPVAIPLPLKGGPNTFAGCTKADKTLIQSIIDNPSGFYTNVHNADFPAGAIRGQLMSFAPAAV